MVSLITFIETLCVITMDRIPWLHINAVLGSLIVTVGLWFLVGGISLIPAMMLAVILAGLLSWWATTIAQVWMASTFLLGLESLAWPILQMVDLQKLGPEPPMEDMQRIFTAVLFGLFSGVFWMTFAYGLYKRSRPPVSPSHIPTNPASQGKKKKSKGKR